MLKINKNGFTLVELLATIVVLGILITITIYIATNVINRSKEKSYLVTINEIEKNAGNYLTENKDRLFYLTDINNEYEYQCITVENLIDYGYIANDVTKSKVSNDKYVSKDDYIYIERDIFNKTITKSLYTGTNIDKEVICNKAILATGDIAFISNPNFNEWSRSKEIKIIYKIRNIKDQRTINDYMFTHSYDGESIYDEKNDTFSDNTKTKIIEAKSNGKLDGNIIIEDETIASNNVEIDHIDNLGPVITSDYQGNKKVRHNVTIPLKVTDIGIGVDYDTFTKEDIKVTIGEVEINNFKLEKNGDDDYNLKITDNNHEGKLKLKIDKDKVFDKLANGNDETIIDTEIVFEIGEIETVWIYEYVGHVQTFEVPYDGNYKIELWGAQGGNGYLNIQRRITPAYLLDGPAKGAYVSGNILLNSDETLYVYVGGKGNDGIEVGINAEGGWNGGGSAHWDGEDDENAGAGGGATDIRYFGNVNPSEDDLKWDSYLGLNSRIMVAAGAGGNSLGTGGVGGGLNGGRGNRRSMKDAEGTVAASTQTSGNDFGIGGSAPKGCVSYSQYYYRGTWGASGGGGGYYGGYANTGTNCNGSGGSSFISGYPGCNAITSASDRTHTNQPNHYSGKVFTDGQMQAGIREGHGYAKITYLDA